MELTLIRKLQDEVGLTHEQAKLAVACIREYIIEKQGDPDWDTFLKVKASNYAEKAKETGQQLSEKANHLRDKAIDALDDFSDKTQEKIKDLRSKAADFIAPDED